jgi:hypothetical protein
VGVGLDLAPGAHQPLGVRVEDFGRVGITQQTFNTLAVAAVSIDGHPAPILLALAVALALSSMCHPLFALSRMNFGWHGRLPPRVNGQRTERRQSPQSLLLFQLRDRNAALDASLDCPPLAFCSSASSLSLSPASFRLDLSVLIERSFPPFFRLSNNFPRHLASQSIFRILFLFFWDLSI